MASRTITATGPYLLGTASFDQSFVAGMKISIYGFTGSLQIQKADAIRGDDTKLITPVFQNAAYSGANTGSPATAGTAITSDGSYLVDATASQIQLSVTDVGDGNFTVFWQPVEGAVGGVSSSGGGSSLSAVATAAAPTYVEGSTDPLSMNLAGALRVTAPATTVPLLTQGTDQTGSFFTPPMDATGREGYQIITGGAVAATASAAGIKPVLTGGSDASGNVQVAPFVLPSAATSINLVAPLVVANINARNSTSGMTALGVMSLLTDGNSNPAALATGLVEYNGATYDRRRNNAAIVGLASAARAATTPTPDQTSYNWRGVIVYINVTALTATGSLTATLQGKDSISGNYYDLLTGVAIVATGNQQLYFYPGAATTANVSAPGRIPRTWRVNIVHGNGVSVTYSVSLDMLG